MTTIENEQENNSDDKWLINKITLLLKSLAKRGEKEQKTNMKELIVMISAMKTAVSTESCPPWCGASFARFQ